MVTLWRVGRTKPPSEESSSKEITRSFIRSVVILFRFRMDQDVAKAVLRALIPEVRSHSEDRAQISVRMRGGVIAIRAEGSDISRLRATVNSYVRLINAGSESVKTSQLR